MGHHADVHYPPHLGRAIKHLYDKAKSADLMNGGQENSSLTFSLEGFMPDFLKEYGGKVSNALEEYVGKIRIDGRTISNVRLAYAIDVVDEEERDLEAYLKISTKPAQGIKWK